MHLEQATVINEYNFDQLSIREIEKIPIHFKLGAWIWFGLCTVASLIGVHGFLPVLFIPIALFCYWTLLARPMRESPFALLLLATGSSDILIFLGPILFLVRAAMQRCLYIPNKVYGHLFLLFLLSVLASIFISWTTVEFRPIQTVFWGGTFLVPLAVACLGFKMVRSHVVVARYVMLLIVMELMPVITQVPLYLSSGSPDAITGTWMDADIVSFWGASLLMATLVWFLRLKGHAWVKPLLLMAIATILMLLASGKIYSAMVIVAGLCFIFFSLDTVKSALGGRFKVVAFSILTICISIAVLYQTYQVKPVIEKWTAYQMEKSQKIIFLKRVFLNMNTYGYSDIFGVGPGMLGSRAANSVSGNVLAKGKQDLQGFLMNAPQPVENIMKGLFTQELTDSIKWMSATLIFPFSGIAAVKGELGWVGLILLVGVILARYWPAKNRVTDSYYVSIAHLMVSCAGISTIGLALFDTVWEMPKITVFMSGILLGLGGGKRPDFIYTQSAGS